ncbi:MAG: phosphotransferase family protein [Gammaproteobacteria bacterium]
MTHPDSAEQAQAKDEIVALLEQRMQRSFGAGVSIDNVDFPTLGGSNRTIIFDLNDGSTTRRLVSRQETYTLGSTPFLPPEIQFKILELAFAAGLAVPEPIVEFVPEDGLGRGHVIGFERGETLPKRILHDDEFADARRLFPQQAGQFLAKLHDIAVDKADFLAAMPDSIDPLNAQRERYDYYGEPHPALEYAFRWLEDNRPIGSKRCLVHGDFRIGNILMTDQGINAVLDWECAYLGDPMADFGWLTTPAWRFGNLHKPAGGIAGTEGLYAAYENAGGQKVDEASVHWWRVFGSLRWAVINIMQLHGHLHGGRRSPAFAACGRNTALIEYDLLLLLAGRLK